VRQLLAVLPLPVQERLLLFTQDRGEARGTLEELFERRGVQEVLIDTR